MPALFVSSLFILAIQLALFGLLWLEDPLTTQIALVAHLVIILISAIWYSNRWGESSLALSGFIAVLVGFLPVIGCAFLFLIDNHSLLRSYGLREGLGALGARKETPQDSLNYFSAPEHYSKGNIRKTRNLIASLDDEAYLGLLIASRHLPDNEAYALLTEALFSPFESARLMAYSMRGKLEDKIIDNLEEKLDALKLTKNDKQKSALHIELAQDYLHIMNIGIESFDAEGLLTEANRHCRLGLKLNNKSISGFKTLSKVLRLEGNLANARKAEQKAFSLASI